MSIESYRENQEQTPKLTEQEKEEMYLRCKQKVDDAWGHISTLCSKDMPKSNKDIAGNAFKELFNEGAMIMVGHNMMGIDNFCNKLKNGEIDYQSLKQLDTRTTFKEGQFIKKTIPMPDGNTQIIWQRKIDSMQFKPHINGNEKSELKGVDDIKTERIKDEERQQKYENIKNANIITKGLTAENNKLKRIDENAAENLINSIA